MKALLIKDWKLLKNQKQFFGVVSIIALVFLITNENPSFVISYVVIMFTVFTISTLQYDDYEKGMSYLLTLPVNRKEYVVEKYVFGLISAVIVGSVMLAAAYAASLVRGTEPDLETMLVSDIAAIVLAVGFLSFTIPLQLKFGVEKSRIAWMAVFMVIFVTAFVGTRILKTSGQSADKFLRRLETISPSVILCVVLGICLVLVAVSAAIAMKALENKEF